LAVDGRIRINNNILSYLSQFNREHLNKLYLVLLTYQSVRPS